ncbi:MAG: peptide chain release factor-like protein [Pirellulales bacterium]
MSEVLHPSALPLEQLRAECVVQRVRRSGPGGQHRNKVETGVVIRHEPTGVRAEANERRSQAENLAIAWQRLRVRLALAVRKEAPNGGPSALWHSRGVAVSQGHCDYPALLAEALDMLAASDWDIAAAAGRLGVSRSQLTKFLRREPEAFSQLNAERAAKGLRKLA